MRPLRTCANYKVRSCGFNIDSRENDNWGIVLEL
jgi:hypothetical protein